jgi:hypothetical protein
MSRSRPTKPKLFTVEEANAALPLVRAITQDMVKLSREIVDRRERLAVLADHRSEKNSSPYSDELAQIEEELEKDNLRLKEYVGELTDLGVEPKSATEGLVDFPATVDGRLAYLCWKLGEPEVLFWHHLDAGFAGRQPLTADSVSGEGADPGSDSAL